MLFVSTKVFLLIRDMVVKRWNRQFGCETTHPTQKFNSMNMLRDNMGMTIIDLWGCGDCYRQKT